MARVAPILTGLGPLGNNNPVDRTRYRPAVASRLRYSEIGSITPRSFELNGDRASVTVPASYAKNGQIATLPLPPDLAADIGPALAAAPAGRPLFPLPSGEGARMLRGDLDLAGILYRDQAGRVFDFHALRCRCATLADQANISLRVVQRMMRHSSLDLTNRYTQPRMHEMEGRRPPCPVSGPVPPNPSLLSSRVRMGNISENALPTICPPEGTFQGGIWRIPT